MDPNTVRWITFAFEVLQIIAAALALWLAGGLLLDQFISFFTREVEYEIEEEGLDVSTLPPVEDPSVETGVEETSPQMQAEAQAASTIWVQEINRSATIIAWLALAGFFFLPLVDILTTIRTLIFLGTSWTEIYQSSTANEWGVISQGIYFLITVVLMLIVYGAAYWIGRRFFNDPTNPWTAELPLSGVEKTMVLLGVGGLIHFILRNFLLNLTWSDLPFRDAQPLTGNTGILAFLAPLLVGVLLVFIALIIMNSAILKQEIDAEEVEI